MKRIFIFFTVLLILAACDQNRNNPGLSYFPDMQESRAYETFSHNNNFDNKSSSQKPVPGSIPRGYIPLGFEKTIDNRIFVGKNMSLDFDFTPQDMIIGKKQYQIFCANCHGKLGDGKGFLFTSGKYPYKVADLLSTKMKIAPEGEIFHVISMGYGVMGSHAAQISQKDRWKISRYIKNVLQK